jgi:hypothetical protein
MNILRTPGNKKLLLDSGQESLAQLPLTSHTDVIVETVETASWQLGYDEPIKAGDVCVLHFDAPRRYRCGNG